MNLLSSTSIFSFFTLISRVLGYVRDILIAVFLGASIYADAFFVAFRLPNTFRRLFAEGTFNAAFIPSYAAVKIESKSKGNLVAVISNGSAILGLGNLGSLASKPVMEGKSVLFKRFADIDSIDIEIDSKDTNSIIETIKNISGTFGGINLEDIAAPDCFIIEQKLKEILDIPVFHDDQHGTAIITTAALINALDISKKKISEVKVVINGAGASAQACANLFKSSGV